MTDFIFANCMDYSKEYGCTFLRAFETLFGDIPEEEYNAIFDYIERNQSKW